MAKLIEGTDYKVIDNFLDKNYFNDLVNFASNPELATKLLQWIYCPTIAYREEQNSLDCYFCSIIFGNYGDSSIKSDHYSLFKPFWNILNIRSLIRIKTNLYPRTESLIEHEKHIDYSFKHNGAILSLNTCDGYTILEDGTRIESIANRMLFFDPSKYHGSTNCTNDKARFNINFNYF